MVKEALVVPTSILFSEKDFKGYLDSEEHDFISIILDNHDYGERSEELEHNEDLQQIIPYVWIVNPSDKKVFVYRRANDDNYSEYRLKDKISGGIGGHIERIDSENPIIQGMMRELMEEVKMDEYNEPKIIGYINDDTTSVERTHFAVVAVAESSGNVEAGDSEMTQGKFYSIEEFDKMFEDPELDIEPWTKISWPAVKKYLESK